MKCERLGCHPGDDVIALADRVRCAKCFADLGAARYEEVLVWKADPVTHMRHLTLVSAEEAEKYEKADKFKL